MTAHTDLAGRKFGRLLVVCRGRAGKKAGWECVCDCGGATCVTTNRLLHGITKSCGCLMRASWQAAAAANKRHGMRKTPTWRAWSAMKARCLNPKHIQFKDYGGRGITVCDEWRSSFESFLAYMGNAPAGYQLDRWPNNDGNYEPGNCRWATPQQNSSNRRSNRLITHNGVTKTLTQWAIEAGISHTALSRRLVRNWSINAALTTPSRNT